MDKKDTKPTLKWSIKRQFILYIFVSTLLIVGFTYGLSLFSKTVMLNTTYQSNPTSDQAESIQPPIKGLFRVPTVTIDDNGGRVGFEINKEVAGLFSDFQRVLIEDYQHIFFTGFFILIFMQLLISYHFVKHKFISPLEEVSADIGQLVEGKYTLVEMEPSGNEISQLKHHIFKLSHALEQAEIYQKTSEQQRKTLIAGLSHDLKTPLTNIIGYSETLQLSGALSDEAKSYLEIIFRNATLANQMINNIKNVNHFDKMKSDIKLENVEISALFNNCADDFRELLKKKEQNIEPHIAEGLVFITDKEFLRRIFNNLIQNFVNHSGINTKLNVMSYFESDNLVLDFNDNGKGVPKHMVGRLTELMYKGDASRSDLENSGIGLYNVLSIVEMLNGKIEIISDEGQGMSVVIRLPKQLGKESQMEG